MSQICDTHNLQLVDVVMVMEAADDGNKNGGGDGDGDAENG